MSYRDTARGNNSLLAISRDWLRRADRASVPIRLAVETNPSAEGEHVTFAEEGRRSMRRVIRAVDSRLDGTRTYTGFAVHDLVRLAGARPLSQLSRRTSGGAPRVPPPRETSLPACAGCWRRGRSTS